MGKKKRPILHSGLSLRSAIRGTSRRSSKSPILHSGRSPFPKYKPKKRVKKGVWKS